MHSMNIARLVLFVALIVFSLMVLGIASYFTYRTNIHYYYYEAAALAIATAALTLCCVTVSLIVNAIRHGAFTSIVWVELVWVGIAWVLWLATAGSLTSMTTHRICARYAYYRTTATDAWVCQLFRAGEAFSWLAWLTVFAWFWTLLICSIVAHAKGHSRVWHQSVTEHAIFTATSAAPAYDMDYKSSTAAPTMHPQHPSVHPALPYGTTSQSMGATPNTSGPYQGNVSVSASTSNARVGHPQHPPYPQV